MCTHPICVCTYLYVYTHTHISLEGSYFKVPKSGALRDWTGAYPGLPPCGPLNELVT